MSESPAHGSVGALNRPKWVQHVLPRRHIVINTHVSLTASSTALVIQPRPSHYPLLRLTKPEPTIVIF